MLTFKLRRRVFWGLALTFVLVGMLGCRAQDLGLRTAIMSRKTAPPALKTVGPKRGKPPEASKDDDYRHPSRWRRKLRAKYA